MKHIFSFFAAAAAALILAACATEPETVSTLNTPVPGAEQDFGFTQVIQQYTMKSLILAQDER